MWFYNFVWSFSNIFCFLFYLSISNAINFLLIIIKCKDMFNNSQFSFKIIFAIEVSNQLIFVPYIISSVFSICNKCFISEIIRSILKLINELIGSPSKMSLISFKLCLTSFLLCLKCIACASNQNLTRWFKNWS